MIIRDDYYGWGQSQLLAEAKKARLFSDNMPVARDEPISGIGLLCLKSFLNTLDKQDTDSSLAFARGFLQTAVCNGFL